MGGGSTRSSESVRGGPHDSICHSITIHFAGRWQMKGHGSQYERKKEAAISALRRQRHIEDAARVVGVGGSTLRRDMRIPEFDAAYRQARRDAMWQSIARLQQNSGAAVSTTLKIMVDQNAPASCRLRAADRVLEY